MTKAGWGDEKRRNEGKGGAIARYTGLLRQDEVGVIVGDTWLTNYHHRKIISKDCGRCQW